MKLNRLYRIRYPIFLGFLLYLAASGFSQKQGVYGGQLKYPKLRDIEIPRVERVTLANGMQLFLVEDHELPTISIQAMIRTGSIYEPPEKIGLADITGTVMRTGGTASKTGDQIDEELERVAASVETGIGLNSGYANMWVLKEDFDTAMAILADVLMNPAFREDKIELAKIALRTNIAQRNDDVYSIAYREYAKLIYDPNSIYARHTEYATINNISRDDIVAFHKKFYHPNSVMLGVCGDFNTPEMIKKIEAAFKGWEKADVQLPQIPKVQYEYRQTVNLICKKDINQTAIQLGHIDGLRSDPDFFALVVMNRILGEDFTSRLFRNVRSRQGLAYDVFGAYKADYDHPGIFYVGCQTKSAATVRAIRAMTEQVKSMTESEVTDEELAIAKESYLNSYVFNFDTKSKVVNRMMTYEYFGYPPDFLQKTKENIEKVSKKDVLQVARKHLKPDKMQMLAVGRPQDFDEPLSVLGPVREIDINIPAPKGK
jgi:predicted Zn-dependent peptidase